MTLQITRILEREVSEQPFDPNQCRETLRALERWPNLAYKPVLREWEIAQVVWYARWLEEHLDDLEDLLDKEPTPLP